MTRRSRRRSRIASSWKTFVVEVGGIDDLCREQPRFGVGRIEKTLW